MKVRGSVQRNECDCVLLCVERFVPVSFLHDPYCLQKKKRRTVTKTRMKTTTGMTMMIMTVAQKRVELLWMTVFALQVRIVVEKVFKSVLTVKCKLQHSHHPCMSSNMNLQASCKGSF